MKNKELIIGVVVVALIVILYKSCGLSINSERSCKSTLCDGYWSYAYDGEPMISKYGNFIFKKDGTCQYCTMGGMNGNQINGKWQLGEAVKVTEKMAYRIINVTTENSIGMGAGSNFEIQLYGGEGKSYLSLRAASAQYFHFNDDDKPIN